MRNSGGLRYGFSCSHRDCSTARVLADNADRQTKKRGPKPPVLYEPLAEHCGQRVLQHLIVDAGEQLAQNQERDRELIHLSRCGGSPPSLAT